MRELTKEEMKLVVGGGKAGLSGISGGGDSHSGSVTPSFEYKPSKDTSITVAPTVSYSKNNGVQVKGGTITFTKRF